MLQSLQAKCIAGPLGGAASAFCLHQRGPRSAAWLREQGAWATGCHAPGPRKSETPGGRSLQLTERERDRLADTMRLAEALRR